MSTAANIAAVIAFGVCAYILCIWCGIATLVPSLAVTALLAYLFYPVFERKHLIKGVVIVCVAAFIIVSSLGVFGTRQDFVEGFKQGYNGYHAQGQNR